jgi:hypothetical protein
MESLLVLLSVIGLFIARIGFPVSFLIIVGWIIEKWQQRREREIHHHLNKPRLMP